MAGTHRFIVAWSLLARASSTIYPGAKFQNLGGEFWVNVAGYEMKQTLETFSTTKTTDACACRNQCFAISTCLTACYYPGGNCSLSNSVSEAVPVEGEDTVYFYKIPHPVSRKRDNFYYFEYPENVHFYGARQKCRDYGFRLAQAKTATSFETMRTFNKDSPNPLHHIDLVRVPSEIPKWGDGTTMDRSYFNAADLRTMYLNSVYLAPFYFSKGVIYPGYVHLSVQAICQANFLNMTNW